MPNDKLSNTKKYGPAPEQDAGSDLSDHGFIAIQECRKCDGFHVAVTDGKGSTLVCSHLFESHEEGLAAAKSMLAGGRHNVIVTDTLGSTPPELLN